MFTVKTGTTYMDSLEHTRQEPKRPKAHKTLIFSVKKKTLEYLR
jgi:hypothetical protein